MPNYICKDKECKGNKEATFVSSTVSKFEDKVYCIFDKKTGDKLVCKYCGKNLELLHNPEDGFCQNFLKFGSMTDAEKKSVLKKRASAAFKKEGGKELITQRRKMAIKKMADGK